MPYTAFGYEGKQVRAGCSMLEAIDACGARSGTALSWTLGQDSRFGDRRWWISDLRPFHRDYPDWQVSYSLESILSEIYNEKYERWLGGRASAARDA